MNNFSYPNPVQNVLTISFTDTKARTIRITDMSGAVLNEIISADQQVAIEVSSLPKGIYFLSVDAKVQNL